MGSPTFLPKGDVDLDDAVLRDLFRRNPGEAAARTSVIAEILAARLERPTLVEPWPRQGTFHLIHRARLQSGQSLIVRSSLPDIFPTDHSLRIEQRIFPPLAPVGLRLPKILLLSVGDRRAAPFDFVIMDEIAGGGLNTLPEHALEDPALWRDLGATLRRVHSVAGEGAGPIAPYD